MLFEMVYNGQAVWQPRGSVVASFFSMTITSLLTFVYSFQKN